MSKAAERLRARGATVALLAALLVVIAAGVALRFGNLGGKVFYQDEAATALHATGHLEHAELRALFDGEIRPAGELSALDRTAPDRGIAATVQAVAREDSDQGIFYYILERAVIGVFGTSFAALRLLSAVFSVLALWMAWLLARELFDSRPIAATFAAIVALSPFQVLYAHEARSYSMAVFFTLASSYAVLRALRTGKAIDWVAYAAATILGVYTSMVLFLVLGAHVLYVLATRRNALNVRAIAISAVAVIASFVPWALVLNANRAMVSAELTWGATSYAMRAMLEKWLFNAGAQFFDLEWLSLKFAVVGALALLLVVLSLVYLVRSAGRERWAFVLLLGGVTACLFVGRDLIQHSHWSTTARYLIPTWLALQLAVAYTLASWCFEAPAASRRAQAGALVLAGLLAVEAVSSAIGTRAASWYDDELSAPTPQIAALINAANRPTLIVGEKCWIFDLDLSNYLDRDVRFELFSDARNARIRTAGYSRVFVTTPTPAMARALAQQGYTLKRIYLYRSGSSAYANFHRERQAKDTSNPGFPYALYDVARSSTSR